MNDTPDYISYSQYETYLSCGEKYRLSRIVKVPEQPAWYLIGGSAVHEATEAYDKAMWEVKHNVPF
jgi:putative RecB family exonuclease